MENFMKQFKKTENKVNLEDRIMSFGRYKNMKYKDIYETDKDYVRVVVSMKDNKYFKPLRRYFEQQIEKDYGSDTDDENSENNTEDDMVEAHCMDGLNKSVVFE